jgi:hypothetical protein
MFSTKSGLKIKRIPQASGYRSVNKATGKK